MARYSLIFAITAVLGTAFMFKMNMDLTDMISEQDSKLRKVEAEIMAIKSGGSASMIAGAAPIKREVSKSTSSTGYMDKVPKKLQMQKGYYCIVDVADDNAVAYFDGDKIMRTWGEADGTKSFLKKKPDGSGTFTITSDQLRMRIVEASNQSVINRKATIVSFDANFKVTEFDYYGNIFSFNQCLFKKSAIPAKPLKNQPVNP